MSKRFGFVVFQNDSACLTISQCDSQHEDKAGMYVSLCPFEVSDLVSEIMRVNDDIVAQLEGDTIEEKKASWARHFEIMDDQKRYSEWVMGRNSQNKNVREVSNDQDS